MLLVTLDEMMKRVKRLELECGLEPCWSFEQHRSAIARAEPRRGTRWAEAEEQQAVWFLMDYEARLMTYRARPDARPRELGDA